jgi:hypothetical protein
VVAVPGFGAAQRFVLKELCGGEFKQRYPANYEIESDDYASVMKELLSRAGTSAMELSEALDSDKTAYAVFPVRRQMGWLRGVWGNDRKHIDSSERFAEHPLSVPVVLFETLDGDLNGCGTVRKNCNRDRRRQRPRSRNR